MDMGSSPLIDRIISIFFYTVKYPDCQMNSPEIVTIHERHDPSTDPWPFSMDDSRRPRPSHARCSCPSSIAEAVRAKIGGSFMVKKHEETMKHGDDHGL